jgi:hypothetical protein
MNPQEDDLEKKLMEAFEAPPVPVPHKDKPTKDKKRKRSSKTPKDDTDTFMSSSSSSCLPPPPPPPQPQQSTSQEEEMSERRKWFSMLDQYCTLFPEVCKMPVNVSVESCSAEEIRMHLGRAQKKVSMNNELKMARTGLVTVVGVAETCAHFVPYVHLEGLTDSVNSQIEIFDNVLKEMSIKYVGDYAPSPEMVLVFMIGRIAMTTHMANMRLGVYVAPNPDMGPPPTPLSQFVKPSHHKSVVPEQEGVPEPSVQIQRGSQLHFDPEILQ